MCENAYERLVQHPDEQKSELIDVNHAPTFKKLPPAYVITAEYDVLRDEGEYFAARLFKNNVPVSAFCFFFFLLMSKVCLISRSFLVHPLPLLMG